MKHFNFFTFAFILIQILFISCGDIDKSSDIKVGMTYDEVESLLGKPSSISRGANELEFDADFLMTSGKRLVKLSEMNKETKLDTSLWLAPHQIQTVGKLIYVNWAYDKAKSDTFFVLLNNIKQQRDTTFIYGVMRIEHYEVIESIEKVYYEVGYQYSVIFDASSGRITSSGYCPFFVKKLHSEIIRVEDFK